MASTRELALAAGCSLDVHGRHGVPLERVGFRALVQRRALRLLRGKSGERRPEREGFEAERG
eukprot:653419-Alexandrium_andersonii.AAC.1